MPGGLGAVGAIFCTASSFDGEECALLDFACIPVHTVSSGCVVHEFMEWEIVDLCYFVLGPVVTDGGGDVAHGTGFFVGVDGIAFTVVVWETRCCWSLGLLLGRGRVFVNGYCLGREGRSFGVLKEFGAGSASCGEPVR